MKKMKTGNDFLLLFIVISAMLFTWTFENEKFMAKTFRELDSKTPVTIGMTFVNGTIELADYVDLLQFHDYMHIRLDIRSTLIRAKDFENMESLKNLIIKFNNELEPYKKNAQTGNFL